MSIRAIDRRGRVVRVGDRVWAQDAIGGGEFARVLRVCGCNACETSNPLDVHVKIETEGHSNYRRRKRKIVGRVAGMLEVTPSTLLARWLPGRKRRS
jgi:hypothetical protein